MTANAEILNQEHKNALSVPEQALVYDSQKNAFVDVPDSNAKNGLRRVAVKAGIANGSRTEILSGLSEGQTVYLQPLRAPRRATMQTQSNIIPQSGSRHPGCHDHVSPGCVCRGEVFRPHAVGEWSGNAARLHRAPATSMSLRGRITRSTSLATSRAATTAGWGGVARLTMRWRGWPPIPRLIRPAISFAWETTMGTTGLTMSRSTTRSRPRPIPCLWRRVDPGDLQLSNINGTVKAHTGSGSIRADKLGAGSRLETGSGTIEASNLMGSTTLQTGSGEIHAQLSSAGDVVAGTGSGSISNWKTYKGQ